MRGPSWFRIWCHALLTMLMLVGNVLAPFRTSSLGRPFLESLSHHSARHSVIGVRTLTSISTSLGHRAVTGLASGGSDHSEIAKSAGAFSSFPRTPIDALSLPRAARPDTRPTPPLRC